jgi:predicted  nucleic acid-binding Zn-ribbon protein
LDIADILQKLIDIQTVDSGLDELEKLKRNFRAEIATLETAVTECKTRLQTEKKALEELAKNRKTLEIEAGTLDGKIQKYQGQEGEVKSNEQFTALKGEIEKAKQEKSLTEEKELEILFQEDEQKKKIQRINEDLARAEKKAAEDKRSLDQKIADCEKASTDKKADRQTCLAALNPEFAQGYEALRNNGKKIALAQVLEDATCSGCRMQVAPQILNEINRNLAIQRCTCGRYIYRKD